MGAIKIHNKMSDSEANNVIAIWIKRAGKLYTLNNEKAHRLSQEMLMRTLSIVAYMSVGCLEQSQVAGHKIGGISI